MEDDFESWKAKLWPELEKQLSDDAFHVDKQETNQSGIIFHSKPTGTQIFTTNVNTNMSNNI